MTNSNRTVDPKTTDEWYVWGYGRDWSFAALVFARPLAQAVQRVPTDCEWAVLEIAPPQITIHAIDADGSRRNLVQDRCGLCDRDEAALVGVRPDDLADAIPDHYYRYPDELDDAVADFIESAPGRDREDYFDQRDLLCLIIEYNKLVRDKETAVWIVDVDGDEDYERSIRGHAPDALPDGTDEVIGLGMEYDQKEAEHWSLEAFISEQE